MPDESRPREKFLKLGAEALTDAELLALIVQKGTKKENAVEMSNSLLSAVGIGRLSECSLKELQEISGIGFAKACQIKALFEFSRRHNLAIKPAKKIKSAKDVFNLFRERLRDEKQENFIVLILNARNAVVHEQLVTKGILDASLIHPREVFRTAVKNAASRLILVHNHPSGDNAPSKEDISITKKLSKAGEILGIKILDHIIIGRDSYWSWKESRTHQ